MRPRVSTLGNDGGDVLHVGQLDGASAVEDGSAGNARQRCGPSVPQDVRGIRGAHAAQGQADVHVCSHLCAHRPGGTLSRGDEVQPQTASLRGQPQQDVHRVGVRLGEDAELVDSDHEPCRGTRDGGRGVRVCALPRGEVRERERAQLFLATLQFGGDPLESTSRRPGIQVRQERMRVGESLQTCER